MSYIHEVLIDSPGTLVEVADRVAEVLGLRILSDQKRERRIALESGQPIVVGPVGYVDEGEDLDFSSYSFKVVMWDSSQAAAVFDAISTATEWPIALFDEEQGAFIERRGTPTAELHPAS